MNLLCEMKVRWRFKGLEKKREGVKIGKHTMEAHAKVDEEWGVCWEGRILNSGSNEGIPDKGINGGMGKMKTWVSR